MVQVIKYTTMTYDYLDAYIRSMGITDYGIIKSIHNKKTGITQYKVYDYYVTQCLLTLEFKLVV